jgi:hypothetical protein
MSAEMLWRRNDVLYTWGDTGDAPRIVATVVVEVLPDERIVVYPATGLHDWVVRPGDAARTLPEAERLFRDPPEKNGRVTLCDGDLRVVFERAWTCPQGAQA